MPAPTRIKNYKLDQSLLLNAYFLNLFGYKTVNELYLDMKSPDLEGTIDGVSLLCKELMEHIADASLTSAQMLEYDHNIISHTDAINRERENRITWKYFQYLALIFTEIYLDRYFTNRESFCEELNRFQKIKYEEGGAWNAFYDPIKPEELNKLAFWCATGSGKTLLMHIHLKQFMHYTTKYHHSQPDRTLLITPNEGLSSQHIEEFSLSDIHAEAFSPRGKKWYTDVEVIEITKLADESGEKTVSVKCFEGNNLVFVDEAHKGSSGDIWWKNREALTKQGFSFEYSATFGQAVASQSTANDRVRRRLEYGKCTLFNYSYRYFYNDGFGKDYNVMNLKMWYEGAQLRLYLTAYLLCLYEQTMIYNSDARVNTQFLIDRPLGVFVGTSVNAQQSGNANVATTDVLEVLGFLRDYLENRSEFIGYIAQLLNPVEGIKDADGHSLFARSFAFIKKGMGDGQELQRAENIYDGIRSVLFHAETPTATIVLDLLKGANEEIGVRVGEGKYFAVINIGNNTQFIKTCKDLEHPYECHPKEFTEASLFRTINDEGSNIMMLIGAKKFNTGWNSYRVSVMGLMKIGQTEGSDIIQMFGRGVRLRGYKHSLKRSSELPEDIKPSELPEQLRTVETLYVFGVKAEYMKVFDEATKANDMPEGSSDTETITIPTMLTVEPFPSDLKIIQVKEKADFKKQEVLDITQYKDKVGVTLDMYATAVSYYSGEGESGSVVTRNIGKLSAMHINLLDWNEIYYQLTDMIVDRGWHNMMFSKAELKGVMADTSWYTLYIPEKELLPCSFGKDVAKWQQIATTLLRAYIEKVYSRQRRIYNDDNVVSVPLSVDSENIFKKHTIQIRKDKTEEAKHIQQLIDMIESKTMTADTMIESPWFEGLYFDKHLYIPLLYLMEKDITGFRPYVDRFSGQPWLKISPVPLNDGERDFIKDLRTFCQNHVDDDILKNRKLFLLRNQSKKGVGFFDGNGFYPDFILWVKEGRKQKVVFIDPKGIRNLDDGMKNPKIQLYARLRDVIMPQLRDRNLKLDSYILSVTPYNKIRWNAKPEKQTFIDNHVLFQKDDDDYIEMMMKNILRN
ncbi:MAG: DEAD/DEAH box helicase family protein [Prevotella sp.]|nr:DEAD/DEAH box helicase family protein [Prevotella sp.]